MTSDENPFPARPATPRRQFLFILVTTAALLGLCSFVLISWRGVDQEVRQALRHSAAPSVYAMQPSGEVSAVDAFSWKYALPEGGWFEVVVRASPAASAPELARSGALTEPVWTPPADTLGGGLPAQIYWTVEVFDPAGKLVDLLTTDATITAP